MRLLRFAAIHLTKVLPRGANLAEMRKRTRWTWTG